MRSHGQRGCLCRCCWSPVEQELAGLLWEALGGWPHGQPHLARSVRASGRHTHQLKRERGAPATSDGDRRGDGDSAPCWRRLGVWAKFLPRLHPLPLGLQLAYATGTSRKGGINNNNACREC